MINSKTSFAALISWALLILAPGILHAQGAKIGGVVKDTSGAVLPGVTVVASSPALIEKSHTVTTDGAGNYLIIDLRPGTYTVTFTLQGFSTVRRENLDLPANFTAVGQRGDARRRRPRMRSP